MSIRALDARLDARRTACSPAAAEERAFILLKFRRTRGGRAARPARRSAAPARARRGSGWRSPTAFSPPATGARADDPRRNGRGRRGRARQRIAPATSGRRSTISPKAFSEVLTAFAADLARLQRSAPPVGLVQVAHYVDPQNSSATALLALLLAAAGPAREACLFVGSAGRCADLPGPRRAIRILTDGKRLERSLAGCGSRRGGAPGADRAIIRASATSSRR